MAASTKSTPMMAQYHRLKKESPDGSLLLFRLGDFYELFFEDAKDGAEILRVALTKRGSTPMCGIPFHAASNYIGRLLKAGKKVAICEQVEEAKPGKLVDRRITQVLTPGAHFDEKLLSDEKSNYLVSVFQQNNKFGVAWLDWTTAEFCASEFDSVSGLLSELDRLMPSEIIYPEDDVELESSLSDWKTKAEQYDSYVFNLEHAQYHLLEHFKVTSLDGFGLHSKTHAIVASGAALHYLKIYLRREVEHLTQLQFRQHQDTVVLDVISLRNLEILQPSHYVSDQGAHSSDSTLFKALNKTVTPMGARKLRDWLTQPLRNISAIRQRHSVVGKWLNHQDQLIHFRDLLKEIHDLERVLTRLTQGAGGGPRDLVALKGGLRQLPGIKKSILDLSSLLDPEPDQATFSQVENVSQTPTDGDENQSIPDLMSQLADRIQELPELSDLLGQSLDDEPSATLKDGGFISDGYHKELDELRAASKDGKQWIVDLQQNEIDETGIPSLKVKYNQVFGYFIEVTRTHIDKVPDRYQRKQTIANGERFITPELKEIENKILGSEERSIKLEQELFFNLRDEVKNHLSIIQNTAQALAELDVLSCFAEQARLYNYNCPEISNEGQLDIIDGRHPVIDQSVLDEPFVPNDTRLDGEQEQVAIITGPNMAGKSTYIRQVALLVLMAHTGSFVPATSARIDVVDRIFTRIGASDNLSKGQSTFMVEMSEAANILNNATSESLIILDELGRGTSTFDGLSLAWSIVEFLHNQVGAKTLFATHYHELTELAGRLNRVVNYNVQVKEYRDEIIFIRKIVRGGTDKSYGIQVARLAGIPKPVLDRAKEILNNLEESDLTPLNDSESGPTDGNKPVRAQRRILRNIDDPDQLDFFSHLKK